MRTRGDGWTRAVGWLKVILPLAALTLLSLLFLVARSINPEDAIPYAEVDIEDRLREPRMTLPDYSGLTEDGASIHVTGAEARPQSSEKTGASARVVFGTLDTPDGAKTELAAQTAQMDPKGLVVTFEGDVLVTNSTGYEVASEKMSARLDRTEVRSLAPVDATGPAGRITAEEMVLTQDTDSPQGYVLVFNGDVKLVYQPGR